jgi:NAD(P)-dependent dehydrogenase (short-subunit alcohol dehydrogenase family)
MVFAQVSVKIEATELLRPGVLAGTAAVLARIAQVAPAQDGGLTATVREAFAQLGASVYECEPTASGKLEADDASVGDAVAAALAELGEVGVLVVDAASAFAAAAAQGAGGEAGAGREGLVRALEASWRVTQAVAHAAFIERGTSGRIIYIAPAPDAGIHADAARAGLENLARTLSIEWARYGIAPVTIAPASGTSADQIAALCAYLASPAGDYFSGCLLDLRGPHAAAGSIAGR